jgi:hypothetical protein
VSEFDPPQVRRVLRRLSISQPNIFGADGHHFKLASPLSESAATAFEHHHNILLPRDYRDFITQISNGGPGPYYGIFPLGQMDDTGGTLQAWPDGFVGILAEPFPHRDAWNDLSGMPAGDLLSTDESEYWRRLEVFEKKYWGPSVTNGAIPICHEGCALRIWLVITGEEAGHLWEDRRAESTGLLPVVLKNGSRATFSAWYAEWLADALQMA